MATRPSRSRFSDILTAQTIRLIEDQGPLEDSEAMRQAWRLQSRPEERLLARARLLSKRIGLDREFERWRDLAFFVWLGLAVLVFCMAYGMAATLLGGGRSINAVLAFIGVLGMHAFTLLLWLSSVTVLSFSPIDIGSRISLGNLFLRLMARIPVERGPYSVTLARAVRDLFRQSRLTPWAFGLISHTIWAAAFILLLFALWLGFSFAAYRLTWETTILHADFFVGFVRATGWLPSLFGFPVPDTATLLSPNAAGSDQRAWALWLIGCTFVYGFLVRLILAALCWDQWRQAKENISLDMTDPYFRKILARFEQMEASEIIDREQRPDALSSAAPGSGVPHAQLPALIGFELPDEFDWPPPGISMPLSLNIRIQGSSEERRQLLEQLAQIRPGNLLVACRAATTPDRGTERFLREAMLSAGQCALLLLANTRVSEPDLKRWRAWLVDSNMRGIRLFSDPDQAAPWLGTNHD